MLNTDTINKYLEDNSLPPNDGYLLKDAGEGVFIAEWDLEIDEPTTEQLEALTAAVEADRVIEEWKTEMFQLDMEYATPENIARFMEDFYDDSPAALAVKPQKFKDKHTERKTIRAERPE